MGKEGKGREGNSRGWWVSMILMMDEWMGSNDAFFDRKNYAITFLCVHALRIFLVCVFVLYCIILSMSMRTCMDLYTFTLKCILDSNIVVYTYLYICKFGRMKLREQEKERGNGQIRYYGS